MAKLHTHSERDVNPEQNLFRHAIAGWAKQFAKETSIDLSDLINLKRSPGP